MVKLSRTVTLEPEIVEKLKQDGDKNGRDFSAEVNFACKKYLESIK